MRKEQWGKANALWIRALAPHYAAVVVRQCFTIGAKRVLIDSQLPGASASPQGSICVPGDGFGVGFRYHLSTAASTVQSIRL